MNTLAKPADVPEGWQDLLRECVLFGILFKAVLVDLQRMQALPLKLSYHALLGEMSRQAERYHHRMKQRLQQHGCELLNSVKQGKLYIVQLRVAGYEQEAIYSIELLRAECGQRIWTWAANDILRRKEPGSNEGKDSL